METMNLMDEDGSDSFDANECLSGKRCFFLNKTMVIHPPNRSGSSQSQL